MLVKPFFTSVITVFFLVIVGVLLFSNVQAQIACGGASDPLCAVGLLCVDNVCNVPPPIWDSRSLTVTGTPQNASFDVQNDSRVLGNLTVGNATAGTGHILTNAIYSRRGNDDAPGDNDDQPDNIWIGDSNDSVNVLGRLFAGSREVVTGINSTTNLNTGIIVGGTGSERTASLRLDCSVNEILKRNATGWACAEDATGAGGAGDEHLFTDWWNKGAPTLTTLKLTAGAGNDKVLTSDANGLGSWKTPASVDVSRFITQPATCGVGQILQWNGEIWICANDAIGSGGGLSGTGAANKLAFWTGASSLGQDANLHWDFTNDRLGVGTISPAEKLEIRDDTADSITETVRLRITDTNSNPELQLQYGSGVNDHWAIFADRIVEAGHPDDSNLRFWNSGSNKVTITRYGWVGIGTDNPLNLLHVSGRTQINDMLIGEKVGGFNIIQPMNGGLRIAPGPGVGVVVSTTNKVGIGTITPVEQLDVAGNIRATNTVQNPELQLQYGIGTDDHWSVYVDQIKKDLRFWNASNKFWFSQGGDFVASHSVNVSDSGCFGPVIVGATSETYDGNLNNAGGYKEIDSICNATATGSHQCTTEEVMNSIHCGAIWTDATKATLKSIIPVGVGQYVWIGNGAPSMPTPTNDCYGWTRNDVVREYQSRGTAWYFNTDGGASYSRSCAEARKILCCK